MQNKLVKLSPLSDHHFEALRNLDRTDIFAFFTDNLAIDSVLKNWITEALLEAKKATKKPFVIIDKSVNKIAGTTSYGNISQKDQRLEIGWTWLGKEFHGSGLNKQVKFLLLENAFEKMNCKRVEFKTDILNKQSRRALQKIGATEEGILRQHTRMHDGRWRDTIYYSILNSEWPQIKKVLNKK